MKSNLVLVSAPVVYKEVKSKIYWLLVKQNEEDDWEAPKIIVRKGESSVRAGLRLMGERGGMTTKVLEEAGRVGGVTSLNGKSLPQRTIYYLMVLKSSTKESVGFHDTLWLEYAKTIRKIKSKRERAMYKGARAQYQKLKKEKEARKKSKKS